MEKEKLNPALVYVLAIIGLLCCCFGGLGFILAGAAYFIAHTQINKVADNPDAYDLDSAKAMKTAKIVALVILIINILYLAWSIYSIQAMGGWDVYMEKITEIIEEAQRNQG
ncbi:CCC motif membrane protein [uncultured Winogradskyella sp.]|uniref:CCC motif membrane protein n=1 Tax=uncultured Winogradskyella sp. TaxID=395353 RepID=UPI0026293B1A|nr:CCC motif membrane protein [uncultured Winogradskyella sp.]